MSLALRVRRKPEGRESNPSTQETSEQSLIFPRLVSVLGNPGQNVLGFSCEQTQSNLGFRVSKQRDAQAVVGAARR